MIIIHQGRPIVHHLISSWISSWPPRIPAPHRNTEACLPKHPMFAHIDLSHMQLGGAFEDVFVIFTWNPIRQMVEKFEDFSKMGWKKTSNQASFWPWHAFLFGDALMLSKDDSRRARDASHLAGKFWTTKPGDVGLPWVVESRVASGNSDIPKW